MCVWGKNCRSCALQKAIRSRIVEEIDLNGVPIRLQKPYVVEELCNGCGICENVCPLEGKSGIEVFAVKDRTPLKEVVPVSDGGGARQGLTGQESNDPYR